MLTELKKIRNEKGFTQTHAAKECGVSLVTYQLWEKGISEPKPENKIKLEKLFKVNL